jgi:hypothetical protein
MSEERLQILAMIERGTITAQQGIALLKAMDEDGETPAATATLSMEAASVQEAAVSPEPQTPPAVAAPTPEVIEPPQVGIPSPEYVYTPEPEAAPVAEKTPPAPESSADFFRKNPHLQYFRRFWLFPLGLGTFGILLSAAWMYLAWQSGAGFWLACSFFPFMLGVLIVALAWAARQAPWLHLRVKQPHANPANIALSFPLPLGLAGWFLRLFGGRIPNLQATSVDEIILALQHISPETPLYLEVNEGENGEHVEIYIG